MNMACSYQDSELLILEVRRRPVIWDSTSEEYKDKAKKAEAWADIFRCFYPDFDSKGETERKRLGKELQTRWKSIRDSYCKDLRKTKDTRPRSGLARCRRYIFFDQLTFLNKVVATNRDTSTDDAEASFDQESHSRDTPDEWQDEEEKVVYPVFEPSPGPGPSRKRKFILDDRTVQILERECDDNDSDKDFFNSLLPSVRLLTEDQKLEFRIEILLLLKRIKVGGVKRN